MITPIEDPIKILTHAMKYIIDHQPCALSDLTKTDIDAMDIITNCMAQVILAEQDLMMFRLRK